ncbi:hypothetical protein [Bowmanella pacifica]|uniref:HEAT repeat domain-containing protein n=1 Tax=Bowmanella pacifica TaxID=502051 RepID=A0A917YT06_9ALTE|nr:hypothetical protein [Bowmanella pacifica]GGO64099.1 hypothetical protein GCM10010982_02700 [Bowmanella pacifica]
MNRIFLALIGVCFLSESKVYADDWWNKVHVAANDVLVNGCKNYPDVNDLGQRFVCEDAILRLSNMIYSGWLNSDKESRLEQLNCIWNYKGEGKYYVDIFGIPSVKLVVAALIGQGVKNGLANYELQDMRSYALGFIKSRNGAFIQEAVTALGWVGDESDAGVLFAIIEEEREGLAEKAVLALLNIDSSKFGSELSVISEKVRRASLKDFIEKHINP